MAKKTIGVGVISLGWMGRLHARSYRSVSERFPELGVEARLVAAADPIEEVQRAAVEDLGFERAYADYHELLADPEIDVVSICSPNFLHAEIALAAIEAGKPFWIEKPMGVSAEQARTVAQAAEKAGLSKKDTETAINASASTTATPPPSSTCASSCAPASSAASPTCACGSSPTTTPPPWGP